ncbi:MAG: hypothetical protein WC294_07605 [Methanoregula sp.]|jgi:hypothetical protein
MGNNFLITRGMYGMMLMGATGSPATDASLCGKCTKACPQKIAIPEELKKVRSTLGGSARDS